jgi:Tol biopolymer transport system component
MRICLIIVARSLIVLSALIPATTVQAQTEPRTTLKEPGVDGKGLRIPNERPLFRINIDGTGLKQVTREPNRLYGSPDTSPDGKRIACDTWRLGQSYPDSTVAVMNADGSDMRIIGPGAMPSWSPDGMQLVCHTYENPQTIVIMNADGEGRETILNHWGSPRWSPKGNRIATIGEARTISLYDLTTGAERTIFRGPYSLWQGFSISPDGLRFCFGDTEGGVGLATLDERTMQASVRWLVKSGTTQHSSWSPDGQRIVFQWKRPDQEIYQLYLIDADGNEKPQLLPGQNPTRHNCDPDWSPDGKTIVFNSQTP